MKQAGVISQMWPFHIDIIQAIKDYFQEIKEKALSATRRRWEASSITIRNREPFGYRNLKSASSRFYKYTNMILTMGPEWIGCQYRSPIIWYPLDRYHCDYTLRDHNVTQDFIILKKKNGSEYYKEQVYSAYALTQLHINYLIT